MKTPYLSIVIPVYNEQEVLETLYQRLTTALDKLGKTYEVILVNDGSSDNSTTLLNMLHERRPQQFRIIHFNTNYGQHMAIMAGFEHVRGDVVITLDADLQNPPEEIPKLLEKIDAGHDVVGGFRLDRQDSTWRKWVSKLHNIIRAKVLTPKLKMVDEGCMLRAYKRNIVDYMVASQETSTFIPALALTFAHNPTDVGVKHEARAAGESSYNFYKLIRYNFDLATNFSLVPLQFFTMLGMVVSILSTLLVSYMLIRRLLVGPEAQGLFTLFAIQFFLIGIALLGLGILGEYIGRIHQEVRKRPRFVIRENIAPTGSVTATDPPNNRTSTRQEDIVYE